MTETTENYKSDVAVNAVKDLKAELRKAEDHVRVLKADLATVKAELSGGKKPRKPRVALGPGLKADGTQRKTRGPNRPKPLGAYVPKPPLATGIEKGEQG